MGLFKKYFFTVNTTGIALLFVAASLLQGQLLYLSEFRHAEKIIELVGKLDQVGFLLLAGLLLVLAVINLAVEPPKRSKTVLSMVLFALVITLLAKGKFESLGTDSMAELIHFNSQEATDFFTSYLAHVNVTVKECLILFAPFALMPMYAFLSRKNHGAALATDIRLAFIISAGLYLLVGLRFAYPLVTSYYSLDYFRNRLNQAGPQALASLEMQRKEGPNVVVYIGESTSKDNFPVYTAQADPQDPLETIRDELIVYTDVVAAFTHTFPSLYRAFSVSKEPYREQFLLLRDLQRANSIAMLERFGVETYWISNQNLVGHWDWNSELFGKQARHTTVLSAPDRNAPGMVRKSDKELIDAYRKNADALNRPRQFMFLHSYAGHNDYCKNLPEEEKSTVNTDMQAIQRLPQQAVFGDVQISDIEQRMQQIGCYGATMIFIEKNLRAVIDDIRQRPSPIVFLYFSDHGEEVFEGTGHDSRKNSFRMIEVPFIVYFNAAARQAYPDLYKAALANKDKPYSLEWLSDTLLDLAGISSRDRELLSIFRADLDVPKRYVLRRADIWGNQFIVAVDDENVAPGLRLVDQGHDFFRKRSIANTVAASDKGKICAHRTGSLLKYREAIRIFHCVEIDATIDPESGKVYAYRPPARNNLLNLEDLIRSGPPFSGRTVIRISNPRPDNLDILRAGLNRVFDRAQRERVAIEIPHAGHATQMPLRAIADDGYQLFYALPAESGRNCVKRPDDKACVHFRQAISQSDRLGIRGIAFDITALPFAASLGLDGKLEYSIKDLSVATREDINPALLTQSRSYSIPYYSAFDY